MTVTLSKRTEEIVQAQMKSGRYATPDEVVNHLIEEQGLIEMAPGPSDDEIRSSLIAAVKKPTHPYRKGEFVELARRVITEDRGA